jgi:flagellar motor switch protein FliG
MLAQFRDLFNGLAPRQRFTLAAVPLLVLAGLGLAISRGTGPAEEPLFSGKTFSADELQQTCLTLHKSGLSSFRIDGQRIVVPREETPRYNAALIAQSESPSPFGKNWNHALDRKSLLPETDRERQERFDVVRAQDVIAEIRKTPQIADAWIVLSNPGRRGSFSEARRTALLSVTPREGVELSTDRYRSLQQTVASAWNIAERDVTILNTSTGSTFKDPGSTAPLPGQTEISAATAVSLLPPNRIPAGTKSHASGETPMKPRPATARPASSDSLSQWAPTGGALFALCSIAILIRTRRRLPQNAEPATTIEIPAPAEAATASPASASAESPASLSGARRNDSAPGDTAEARESPAIGEGQSAHNRSELLSDRERPARFSDEHPPSPPVPFRFLHEADPDSVLSFVTEEHPQTIALILSHLPAPLAAKVLSNLPSTKKLEVGRRIANIEEASPEVLHDVARSLRNRLTSKLADSFGRAGSASTSAPWLKSPDRVRNHALLASLESEDTVLAERIRRLMFVFDDLLKLDGSAVAALFARVDCSKWALALKGASEELKSKILDNLSPSAAVRLHEELDELGPVRLSDVAAAQHQIVALVRRLEDSGEILIDAGSDELRMIA